MAAIEGAILDPSRKEEKRPSRPPLHRRPLVGRSLDEQLAVLKSDTLQ